VNDELSVINYEFFLYNAAQGSKPFPEIKAVKRELNKEI